MFYANTTVLDEKSLEHLWIMVSMGDPRLGLSGILKGTCISRDDAKWKQAQSCLMGVEESSHS